MFSNQGKVFSDSESMQVRAEAAVLLKQLNFPVCIILFSLKQHFVLCYLLRFWLFFNIYDKWGKWYSCIKILFFFLHFVRVTGIEHVSVSLILSHSLERNNLVSVILCVINSGHRMISFLFINRWTIWRQSY